jgi:hypothetical protein
MSKIVIRGAVHPSVQSGRPQSQNQRRDGFIDFNVAAENSGSRVFRVGNLLWRPRPLVMGTELQLRMRRSAGRANRQYAINASSELAAITAVIESADRPSNNAATTPLDAAPAVI